MLAVFGLTMYSCDDTETYAEQRDRELASISSFIANPTLGEIKGKPIKVISEDEFLKDTVTDLSTNEFVYFEKSGIYMQIVSRGCGSIIKKGESATVISRYTEYNITDNQLQWTNEYSPNFFDKYNVYNASGTFSGSFCMKEDGTAYQSSMYNRSDVSNYGLSPTLTVPEGWLKPLSYIRIGRPANGNEDIARVRLIVPHDKGYVLASNCVFACYYEITYERAI